jgi:hypothetical protein
MWAQINQEHMKNMKNKEESELGQLGQGRKKDSNMGGRI